jgi:hypothetical protein
LRVCDGVKDVGSGYRKHYWEDREDE